MSTASKLIVPRKTACPKVGNPEKKTTCPKVGNPEKKTTQRSSRYGKGVDRTMIMIVAALLSIGERRLQGAATLGIDRGEWGMEECLSFEHPGRHNRPSHSFFASESL